MEAHQHFSSYGDDEIFPYGSRTRRQFHRIEEEVLDSRRVLHDIDNRGGGYDQEVFEDECHPEWVPVDEALANRFVDLDQAILSSTREYLANAGIADAGSIETYEDMEFLEPLIMAEPDLMAGIVRKAKMINQELGRGIILVGDIKKIIIQDGIEAIQQSQTEVDAEELMELGIDRVELSRRQAEGSFEEKLEVRSLARLLREPPMQVFREAIELEAYKQGELLFDEVVARAKGVIYRHNRQEADYLDGKHRAVEKRKALLDQIEIRERIIRELGRMAKFRDEEPQE